MRNWEIFRDFSGDKFATWKNVNISIKLKVPYLENVIFSF